MIEVLTPVEKSTCIYCGGPITRYKGDLGGDDWSHDNPERNGQPGPCPGTFWATPVKSKIEPVTDVQAHYREMRTDAAPATKARTGDGNAL